MIVLVVLLWLSFMVSVWFLWKDFRRREGVLLYKIELLQDEVEALKRGDPTDRMKKFNRLAGELLTVLQEKEDDILTLVEKVEFLERRLTEREGYITREERELLVAGEGRKKRLSVAELHTLEALKRRGR